jgi:hypothetical protein
MYSIYFLQYAIKYASVPTISAEIELTDAAAMHLHRNAGSESPRMKLKVRPRAATLLSTPRHRVRYYSANSVKPVSVNLRSPVKYSEDRRIRWRM